MKLEEDWKNILIKKQKKTMGNAEESNKIDFPELYKTNECYLNNNEMTYHLCKNNFDPTKNKNLYFSLTSRFKLDLLEKLKGKLNKYLFDINYDKCFEFLDENNNSLKSSLLQYLKSKYSFDKTKFILDSENFKASSKIDLKDLNNSVNNGYESNFSIKRYSYELGISTATIRNIVTKNLGYRYKTISVLNENRNTESNKQFAVLYFLKFAHQYLNNYHHIYIDESSFNNSRRGKKRWVHKANHKEFLGPGRIQTANLIFAIYRNKPVHYQVTKKNLNRFTFKDYFEDLLFSIENDVNLKTLYKENKIVFIMDNCPIHKSKSILNFFKENNLNILFLPPYYPDFNMAEFAFRSLKQRFYNHNLRTK